MDGLAEEEREVARRRLGKVLCGKWTVERWIGSGGMADVYAARHRNGREVAVKVLRPALTASATLRKRFQREGYAANQVKHPGAVQILDDDVDDDGSPFLVMELLEGTTLRAAARGGSMGVSEVVRIFEVVLDVLAIAHEAKIVHRDVKPDNIFLTKEGAIKLLDFGIAQLRDGGADAHLTRSNAAMGTPLFMAPEQARGRWDEVDGRTDVWSVGASLFTVLTGSYVHEAATPNEVLIAAATQPAPPVRSRRRDLPSPLAQVIDRALSLDPGARWESARVMREALSRALGEAPAVEEPLAAAVTLGDETRSLPQGLTTTAPLSRTTPAGADGATEQAEEGSLRLREKSSAPVLSARERESPGPERPLGIVEERQTGADAALASRPRSGEPPSLFLRGSIALVVFLGVGGAAFTLRRTDVTMAPSDGAVSASPAILPSSVVPLPRSSDAPSASMDAPAIPVPVEPSAIVAAPARSLAPASPALGRRGVSGAPSSSAAAGASLDPPATLAPSASSSAAPPAGAPRKNPLDRPY